MDKSVVALLADLNIDMATYQKDCETTAAQNPQFAMMAMGQLEMLKLKVPSKNANITKEVLMEYQQYLIDTYPGLAVDSSVTTSLPKSAIKKTMADDMAAEAFGIEEEDMLRYLKSRGPAIMQEQDLFVLIQQFQGIIQQEAMQDMGAGGFGMPGGF